MDMKLTMERRNNSEGLSGLSFSDARLRLAVDEVVEAAQSGEITDPRVLHARLNAAAEGVENGDFKLVNMIRESALSEDQRFEYVKIEATQGERSHPVGVSLGIQRYDLTQEHRFEVAKTLAAQGYWGAFAISEGIENFDLSEEQRFEIAKLVAEKGPYRNRLTSFMASDRIAKYALSPEHQFEIYKIEVVRHAPEFAVRVRELGCTPEQRFELAKLAAPTLGGSMYRGEYLSYFGLTREQYREVDKVAEAAAREYFGSWS